MIEWRQNQTLTTMTSGVISRGSKNRANLSQIDLKNRLDVTRALAGPARGKEVGVGR